MDQQAERQSIYEKELPQNDQQIFNQPIHGDVSKSHNKKKWIFAIVFILTIFTVIGIGILLNKSNTKSKNDDKFYVKIGSTVITQKEIDKYKSGLTDYKKQNPGVIIDGNPDELAKDDLILNAGLKNEADNLDLSLSDKEVREVYKIPESTTIDEFKSQKTENIQDEVGYYESVKAENNAYQNKLFDSLLGKRSLFYVSINFDAPFFRSQKSSDDISNLHSKAIEKLNEDFLPQFNDGVSKEKIASNSDANYLNKSIKVNPEIFFKKMVTSADYIENYSLSEVDEQDALRQAIASNRAAVSSSSLTSSFKDLENVDYGIEVKDLKNTNEEIMKLQKVGDNTGVIASKSGQYMIARLEKLKDGKYDSWQAMLEKYKSDYLPQNRTNKQSLLKNNFIVAKLNQPIKKIDNLFFPPVSAVSCGAHNITVSVRMLDVDTWEQVNGRVSVRQPQGTCTGGSASGNGYASFVGNCYGSPPTYDYSVPNGYNFHSSGSSVWTPSNINSLGLWQAYIFVKKETRRIQGTSTLLPADGQPGFGTNIRIPANSHTITAGGYWPYSNSGTSISGAWNVPKGQNSYPVTAQAPSSFTSNRGTWVLQGDGSKTKPANANNGWHAQISFHYRLDDCQGDECEPPPPPPPPTGTPTCTLSAELSGSAVSGGYTISISWSSTGSNQQTFSGFSGSGASGSSTLSNVTAFPVNISATFTNTSVSPPRSVTCSKQVTLGGYTPDPRYYYPYMRVYGNDVIVGSDFEDDSGACNNYNDDVKIKAYNGANPERGGAYGAGSQFAVFSNGHDDTPEGTSWGEGGIEQFHSNSLRQPSDANPRILNSLKFGNHYSRSIRDPRNPNGPPNWYITIKDLNDGGSSGILHCNPNYFQLMKENGVTEHNSGTLSTIDNEFNNPIPDGKKKKILVNGDLFIDKDIVYENDSWGSISEIPNVTIVVKGNINISPTVKRIDGMLVAQPKCEIPQYSGSGACFSSNFYKNGVINTCSYQNNKVPNYDAPEICNNQLVINGSVIAKKINWYRTQGSTVCPDPDLLGNCTEANPNEPSSSQSIAEVVDFSPELYLSPLNLATDNEGPTNSYDSIVSLPPIL